jgi:hypothetical protein
MLEQAIVALVPDRVEVHVVTVRWRIAVVLRKVSIHSSASSRGRC